MRGGVEFIDNVPRTVTGKILRKDLKKLWSRGGFYEQIYSATNNKMFYCNSDLITIQSVIEPLLTLEVFANVVMSGWQLILVLVSDFRYKVILNWESLLKYRDHVGSLSSCQSG